MHLTHSHAHTHPPTHHTYTPPHIHTLIHHTHTHTHTCTHTHSHTHTHTHTHTHQEGEAGASQTDPRLEDRQQEGDTSLQPGQATSSLQQKLLSELHLAQQVTDQSGSHAPHSFTHAPTHPSTHTEGLHTPHTHHTNGVVTPICAVLRAIRSGSHAACDRPKTAFDRVTTLLNCR